MNVSESKHIAKLLSQLTPGFLPGPIFQQVARLTVTPIIEVVPLRTQENTIEVLLLERDATDPVWAGMLHTPGTVLRSSDKEGSFTDAFSRILQGELKNIVVRSQPIFAGTQFHQVKRGRELALIYYVEIVGEPVVGAFYPVHALPKNIITTQEETISIAIQAYKSNING